MGRAIDLLITYRVIKLLVTPWEKHDAYKLGIIDDKGKVLRKARTLKTSEEKKSYTLLHRFVFNLKRLIGIVPGGKSKLGSYAAALGLLLKEEKEINSIELEKDLYNHLRQNNLISLGDQLNETVGYDYLPKSKFLMIDELRDLEDNVIAEVGDVVENIVDQKPIDKYFGVNLYKVINEETQKAIVVSEDNIERIKF
jgi:hypothetical protein